MKEASYKCKKCNIDYCSISCFKGSNHQSCYEEFCKENVIENMKNSKIKSIEEIAKTGNLLSENRKSLEEERAGKDKIAYERFQYIFKQSSFDRSELKNDDLLSINKSKSNFYLLEQTRKEELLELFQNGELDIDQLKPHEKELFLSFADNQNKISLWFPTWRISEGIYSLNIIGKSINLLISRS